LKTAIVILNFNGENLLAKYLPAMIRHSAGADIWVVDNASTDNSIDYVQNNFPAVKIIQNDKNLGYSGGYNASVRKIDADLLLLLNNDIMVDQPWVPQIQKHFQNHPEVGIAQPKILSEIFNKHFDYAGAAGGRIDFMGLPYCRGRVLDYCTEDQGQYNEVTSVEWASGATFCIRKEVFLELGGFDDDFFMHFEEIDLCIRAMANGWKIHYLGGSEVKHLGGATLPAGHPKKLFFNIRNSMLTYTKTLPLAVYPVWLLMRLGFDFLLGLYFLFSGRWRHTFAIVRAHHSFFYRFPAFWKKRTATFLPFQKTSVFFEYVKMKINPKYDIR